MKLVLQIKAQRRYIHNLRYWEGIKKVDYFFRLFHLALYRVRVDLV